MVAPDTSTNASYDVFISYSHADAEWVREWLVPRLQAARLTVCIDHAAFDIGVPALVNMENAVAASRHTLLVLTPAWVASEWTRFEALLVQSDDPAGLRRRTLPILRDACAVPWRIAMLTYADLRGTPDDAEFARLLDAIRDIRRLPDDRTLVPLGQPDSTPPTMTAAERLAPLPLDRVPDVAPLPRGSRMPLRANPLFVGRADDLMALAAALKGTPAVDTEPVGAAPRGRPPAAVISTGLGGIGKTQLASEFVHRYGQYFAGVCWLSFAEASDRRRGRGLRRAARHGPARLQ